MPAMKGYRVSLANALHSPALLKAPWIVAMDLTGYKWSAGGFRVKLTPKDARFIR